MEANDRSRWVLIGAGVAVAVLVVVAVVLALRATPDLDPHTPEAAVQGFYLAIADDDIDRAFGYLVPGLAASCADFVPYRDGTPSRVVVDASTIEGDTARMEITIDVSYGDDPFGGGGWDTHERVTLTRSGDVWLISRPVWPLEMWGCGEGEL